MIYSKSCLPRLTLPIGPWLCNNLAYSVLITQALLPALRASPQPRVLSVLSAGVHAPYKHYHTDPYLQQHFSLKNCADAAGFYNDLALDTFSRDQSNAKVG